MPRPKLHPKKKQVQPFSLILEPVELETLRNIAAKEKTSMGAIVRRAIHTVLIRTNPELLDSMLEAEIEGFLKRMSQKFPVTEMKGARRSAFKNQVIESLR